MTEQASARLLRGSRALLAALLSALLPGAGSCYLGRLGTAWWALGVALVGPLLSALLWRAEVLGVWGVIGVSGGALLLGHGGGAIGAALETWRGTVKRRFRTGAGYMLLAAGLLVGLRGVSDRWLMASFAVATIAMEPTFEYGDRVLVEPRPTRTGYRRGEVVIRRDPVSGATFIRRLVAVAGDRVELRGAEVLVDGRPLSVGVCTAAYASRCVIERSPDGLRYPVADEFGEAAPPQTLTVPVGQVLLLRDRRDAGTVPAPVAVEELIGVVRAVWWSYNSGGLRGERIGRSPVLPDQDGPQ